MDGKPLTFAAKAPEVAKFWITGIRSGLTALLRNARPSQTRTQHLNTALSMCIGVARPYCASPHVGTRRLPRLEAFLMVFVLDNYDSFTYNLVQYMGELGAEMVIVRRNDELSPSRD